jgi:hypothetical protein
MTTLNQGWTIVGDTISGEKVRVVILRVEPSFGDPRSIIETLFMLGAGIATNIEMKQKFSKSKMYFVTFCDFQFLNTPYSIQLQEAMRKFNKFRVSYDKGTKDFWCIEKVMLKPKQNLRIIPTSSVVYFKEEIKFADSTSEILKSSEETSGIICSSDFIPSDLSDITSSLGTGIYDIWGNEFVDLAKIRNGTYF